MGEEQLDTPWQETLGKYVYRSIFNFVDSIIHFHFISQYIDSGLQEKCY